MSGIDVALGDDGTLDTLAICHCTVCGESWEERFSGEDIDRDANGKIHPVSWEHVSQMCADSHECDTMKGMDYE